MTKLEKVNELFEFASGLYDSDESMESANKLSEIYKIMNGEDEGVENIFKAIILNEFDAQNVVDLPYLRELLEDKESLESNIKYFCDAFSEDEELEFINQIDEKNILEKIEELATLIERFYESGADEDAETVVKKSDKEQYLIIKDLEFDIESTKIFIKNNLLFLEVRAENQKCFGDNWAPYLYVNNGIPVENADELVGKVFEYDYEKDSSQTWIMYVFEHEDITKGRIEILEKNEDTLKIKWTGTANIYANGGYDEDVPFEGVFDIRLQL